MKALVLIDNISENNLLSEWGFSVYIENKGKKILLDSGSSDKYIENADKLGVDLSMVDYAVLSHAHYDHSGGFEEFFRRNSKATLYVSKNCNEKCYSKHGLIKKYIGIPKGLLDKYSGRVSCADGFMKLSDGVYIMPHISDGLSSVGEKARLYRKSGLRLKPDDFCHEQSLVFETDKGLAVFNSCSHSGLENIIKDAGHFFPGKKVYMTVGGLHLSKYNDYDVEKIAETIKALNISRILTGHCTGDEAFCILRSKLDNEIRQTYSGMIIEV